MFPNQEYYHVPMADRKRMVPESMPGESWTRRASTAGRAGSWRRVKRLAAYDFEWVLPGHGYRAHLPFAQMREQMAGHIARMPAQRV